MIELPLGIGNLDFEDWLHGLIAAFVQGGAGAVTGGITVATMDPKDYFLGSHKLYALMLAMFLVNGILGAMAFLRQKPVPDYKTVKTTVETTEQARRPAVVVTTVEETHVEPKELKP